MVPRPSGLSLANWREPPNHRWAFHHIRELIPTENIAASDTADALQSTNDSLRNFYYTDADGSSRSLDDFLVDTSTDALVVLHRGALVLEWYAEHYSPTAPHIVFSVSKSITATLTGVLVARELLEPAAPVTRYVPEARDSAYSDCTVQHVLDMTVSIDFDESYLDKHGQFARYRAATGWNPVTADTQNIDLHDFLLTLQRGDNSHGSTFHYKSPNSDLLGWILERASQQRIAALLHRHLWQPMGTEADAYITLDRTGAARTAGGICAVPRDLARFGELMRLQGACNDRQLVPADWIEDCTQNGNHDAWRRGSFAHLLPDGRYRNQWYQTGYPSGAYFALGIHGQWIYVDPLHQVVIVKLSAQAEPVSDRFDRMTLRAFAAICGAL